MKNLNNAYMAEITVQEMQNIDGGFVFGWSGFSWDMFWSGCKVGLAGGSAAGVAYGSYRYFS